MIESLPERRQRTIRALDLQEAVEELAGRARRVEIPCSNEILRVLMELEGAGGGRAAGAWRIVQPESRNPTQEHAVDTTQGGWPRTACGYRAGGWTVVDHEDELQDVLARPDLCDRCHRVLTATSRRS